MGRAGHADLPVSLPPAAEDVRQPCLRQHPPGDRLPVMRVAGPHPNCRGSGQLRDFPRPGPGSVLSRELGKLDRHLPARWGRHRLVRERLKLSGSRDGLARERWRARSSHTCRPDGTRGLPNSYLDPRHVNVLVEQLCDLFVGCRLEEQIEILSQVLSRFLEGLALARDVEFRAGRHVAGPLPAR